jgi:hypothetical protein
MWSPDEHAPQAIPTSSNTTTKAIILRRFITLINAARPDLLCQKSQPFRPVAKKTSAVLKKVCIFALSIYS